MNSDQSLIRSILLNSIVWSVVRSTIWVAIGRIQGIRPLSTLGVGGLLTGVFTSTIYLIAFVVAFPTADLSHLVPKSFLEKAVWYTLISTTLGIGLFLSLKRAPRTRTNPVADACCGITRKPSS